MKMKYILPILLLSVIALASCQKDPANNLDGDESLVYITNRSQTADFTSYTTFAIADSVAMIYNNQLVERERTQLDANLIAAFASSMQARGYTLTAANNNPDIGITISRIYNDYTSVVDYGSYWDYYGGYWDPFYWGYPGYSYGYPAFYGTYTITDGAVEIDMFDIKNAASNNNQLNYVWNGLIRGEGTFNPANAQKAVDALFAQSSYLRRN